MADKPVPPPKFVNLQRSPVMIPLATGGTKTLQPFYMRGRLTDAEVIVEGEFYRSQLAPRGSLSPFPEAAPIPAWSKEPLAQVAAQMGGPPVAVDADPSAPPAGQDSGVPQAPSQAPMETKQPAAVQRTQPSAPPAPVATTLDEMSFDRLKTIIQEADVPATVEDVGVAVLYILAKRRKVKVKSLPELPSSLDGLAADFDQIALGKDPSKAMNLRSMRVQ